MYCQGRLAVQNFAPDEVLYRRCSAGEIDLETGLPDSSAFTFPRMSVNRGAFSEPGDCRYPANHHDYVVAFTVGDIPTPLQAENRGNTIHFRPFHEPITRDDDSTRDFENYGHTEIRAYRTAACADVDEVKKSSKLPDSVKLKFRQMLADRCRIVCEPRPDLNPNQ